MKKLLALLLSSFLVLTACGQSNSDEHQKNENNKRTENKSEKKTNEKEKKTKDNKKEHESKKDNQQQTKDKQKNNNQQQNNQNQQTQNEQTQQQNNSDIGMHYDPEYDKYGYTGMVDENGIPELDSNVNSNSHEGATPGEDYVPEDNENESNSGGPRSLREIKEDTGKGASEFTQAEIDEANAYAREH